MSAAYTAWGQRNYVYPFQAPSQWDDCFGYNARWGYVKDATGLYYCQNRYYDPANGRWLTRDPIGFSGGINLYGYCGGGPDGAIDPSGLWRSIVLGIVGGVGGFLLGGPPGGIAGAALLGGIGGGADEAQREIDDGEELSVTRIVTAGGMDAALSIICDVGTLGLGKLMITAKLTKLAKTARANVVLTRAQRSAGKRVPRLRMAYIGERVDTEVKAKVGESWLKHFITATPRFTRGPDFTLKKGRSWWDITTPRQWPAHVVKYGPGGTFIPY